MTKEFSSSPFGEQVSMTVPQQQKTTMPAVSQRNLLRRYQRLLNRYQLLSVTLPLSDVAQTLACTPRYARTLLRDMQKEGWVSWVSHPGRNAQGYLQCRLDQKQIALLLERKKSAPDTKQTMQPTAPLKPAQQMPGRPDGGCYTVNVYRPLMAIVPSPSLPDAERHILRMVHVGLTRYLPAQKEPYPGLAHTMTVSRDGLSWHFFLRRGLRWHNGEPFEPEQLLPALRQRAGGPAMPYVTQVTLNGYDLCFHLKQPDIMLPYRLANPAYALAHPKDGTCGLGPFRIARHSDTHLELTRFAGWYGEMAQAAMIVYETDLQCEKEWSTVRLNVRQNALQPVLHNRMESVDAFSFVTFNRNSKRLNAVQQETLRLLIQSLVREIKMQQETLFPLPEWLQVSAPGQGLAQTALPPVLHLACHDTMEMRLLTERLTKSLKYRNCELVVTALEGHYRLRPQENWADNDICLGYVGLSGSTAFTLEERFRHSVMLKAFWPENVWRAANRLLDKNVGGARQGYTSCVMRMMRFCLHHRLLTPLWGQRYRLEVPVNIRGIRCYAQCWPDFTQIWTCEAQENSKIAAG